MLRSIYFFLALIFVLGSLTDVSAQLDKRRNSRNFITGNKRINCPVTVPKDGTIHGLGIRIGDPYGITYKAYFPKNLAFEVIGGSSFHGLYSNFIQGQFLLFPSIAENEYLRHQTNFIYSLQVRALYQRDISPEYPRMQYYVGLGGQYRLLDIDYTYRIPDAEPGRSFATSNQRVATLGPELIIGLEYGWNFAPVTTFAEINFLGEFVTDRIRPRTLGGLGTRINF
jgi:hypothetical protein